MKLRAALVTVLVMTAAAVAGAPAAALEPAGGGWFWQSPVPQGDQLNAVAYGDAGNLWAVGDSGTILHSADAGLTWHMQASGTLEPLGSVDLVDASHGWAAGGRGWYVGLFPLPDDAYSGVILATEDGGATWTSQLELTGKAVADVAFVSDRDGWAVGSSGLILHTADGGSTWTGQTSGVSLNLLCVDFVDALHGYAGGAGGVLLATSNGGATWSRLKSGGFLAVWSDVSSLAVDGAGTLWVGLSMPWSGSPQLAGSSDGGRTWRPVSAGGDFDLWQVAASGRRVAAVGPIRGSAAGSSRVLVSNDGGATWSSHVVGGGVMLGGVALRGGDAACAVGNVIVTSSDGGASWYGRSTRAIGVGTIDLVGPSEGWAAGGSAPYGWYLPFIYGHPGTVDQGSVFHTIDGARWQEQLSDPHHIFVGVDFADASHGWAVGSGGVIEHTADGGATWTRQPSGSRGLLQQVAATGADTAWVLGLEQAKRARTAGAQTTVLLHTLDGGATWTRVAVPKTDFPTAMSWVSPDEGWMVAAVTVGKRLMRKVIHTTDGGAHWTLQSQSAIGPITLPLALDFVDGDHGWLAENDLVNVNGAVTISATSDGGTTWHVVAGQSVFGGDSITGVTLVSPTEGWASGSAIYHTTDGGATWAREVAGLGRPLATIAAYDATHVWAGGSGGILSTVDSVADSVPPITLCDAVGGWTRTTVTPRLTAADVGSAGLAGTEYRVNGGPWTPGLAPPAFPAPADHSGDGSHEVEYRSTDKAGNVEPVQRLSVKIDTIRPVIRLGACVVGHDGVLRVRLRIDDRSCPSIDTFETSIGGYEGFTIPTNRWFTFRDAHGDMGNRFRVGTYPFTFSAKDRAGNAPARIGRGTLVVKSHKSHRGPLSPGTPRAATPLRAAGSRSVAATAVPSWMPEPLRVPLRALLSRLSAGMLPPR